MVPNSLRHHLANIADFLFRAPWWRSRLDPLWSPREGEIKARVVDVIDEAEAMKTFVLATKAPLSWRAGQWVPVTVEVNGRRRTRAYSLSSAPGTPPAITVKRVGSVSGWLHDRVRVGDILTIGEPAGDFVLPTPRPAKLALLSGGSGITPVMSILRDLAQRGPIEDVVFLHSTRSEKATPWVRELARIARSNPGLTLYFVPDPRAQLLTRDKLVEVIPDLADRTTYLCGPDGMRDAFAPIWTTPGLLHVERFRAPAPTVTGDGFVSVRLARQGRDVVVDASTNLLDGLEAAGVSAPRGCGAGLCHRCSCAKRDGETVNLLTGEESREDGLVQLCVSAPRSNLTLDL